MPVSSSKTVWLDLDGKPISCTEKVKVLGENLAELQEIAQEAMDDAILMGVAPSQVRAEFAKVMQDLSSRFSKK